MLRALVTPQASNQNARGHHSNPKPSNVEPKPEGYVVFLAEDELGTNRHKLCQQRSGSRFVSKGLRITDALFSEVGYAGFHVGFRTVDSWAPM